MGIKYFRIKDKRLACTDLLYSLSFIIPRITAPLCYSLYAFRSTVFYYSSPYRLPKGNRAFQFKTCPNPLQWSGVQKNWKRVLPTFLWYFFGNHKVYEHDKRRNVNAFSSKKYWDTDPIWKRKKIGIYTLWALCQLGVDDVFGLSYVAYGLRYLQTN